MPSLVIRSEHRPSPRVWGLLAVLGLASACATNPATGKREFSLVSEGQEVQMGQQGKQDVLRSMAVHPDSTLQRYVSSLGMAMAKKSERPELPWSFVVLEDPVVNAFALPGGPIFITRGILTHMTSEAELVSVLGHEMGHVTARHSARQMSQQQLASVGLMAGMIISPQIAKFGEAASQGLGLLFLKFGRGDELQADELGFKYMVQENYDPREMASMFQTLDRMRGEEGGRVPEWQSTHPDPGNRVANTQQRITALNRSLAGLTVDRDEFMTRTNGLLFGENPREGFFEGTTFHHPELRFRFDFPSGWKTVNQTQQVAGVSSAQDAMISITLAGNAAPSTVLQQFLGQQGIQAGRTSSSPINGLPAALGEFKAQTEQGILAGVIGFVSHNGNTYKIMAYTPEPRAGQYGNLFQQALGSFRPETDTRVLNIKPNRLRIVDLPRAMTVAQFNQAYPSVIPLAQLALINGVGEGDTFPAGSKVKRVVVE